jgi:hypothetical protein
MSGGRPSRVANAMLEMLTKLRTRYPHGFDERTFARLRNAANRYQCDLRQKAIAGTMRIYGRAPQAYVSRVRVAWKAWRRRHTRAGDRPGALRAAA